VTEDALTRQLRGLTSPDRVLTHAPLAGCTTFRIGGPADWLVDVVTVDELAGVLAAAREAGQPVTILGGGSNVLVGDRGVRGLVIRPRMRGVTMAGPDRVRAEAGVSMNGLVRWTVGRGLAGLETWAGTPGTVGGAVYGNAHFGGRNIGDLVAMVHLVTPDGRIEAVPGAAMAFGYDTSRLQQTREVLFSADFVVGEGQVDELRQRARESLAHRKRTQPLALASAGCVFQNPDPARDPLPAGVPASAGALVDRAGLKGFRVGGACVSSVHANFVVADGTATAADVRAVVETARRAVRQRFGIDLRDEIVYLGQF